MTRCRFDGRLDLVLDADCLKWFVSLSLGLIEVEGGRLAVRLELGR